MGKTTVSRKFIVGLLTRASVCALVAACPLPTAVVGSNHGWTPALAQSKEAVAKRNKAIGLYNAQNYREAGRLLDEYLQVAPSDYYALYYNGLCGQQTGNMGKAKACYRQVVQLAPTSQFGQYSQSILSRIEGSLGSSGSSGSSVSYGRSGGGGGSGGANSIDTSIPREWDVPCVRSASGQVFVNAEVEGKPIRLLFDTGAPSVFIGKNQLEAAGIPAPSGPANGQAHGSSNSSAVPAWNVALRVKLGPVERKVLTQIIDDNPAEPLIGQTFFGNFLYTIDSGAGRIHFRQKGIDTGDNRFATNVPFEWREAGNRIIVEVEVNGRRGKALFDTGNTASALAFFSVDQAAQYGLKVPDDADVSVNTGVSGSGTVKRFNVGRMRLGSIDRIDVPVTVGEAHGPAELPLLGAPFWQGYEYTINKEKRQIQFVRR